MVHGLTEPEIAKNKQDNDYDTNDRKMLMVNPPFGFEGSLSGMTSWGGEKFYHATAGRQRTMLLPADNQETMRPRVIYTLPVQSR